MFDVARILYSFCDADVRREAELTLVEDYFKMLSDAMANEGRKLDFTVEQVPCSISFSVVRWPHFSSVKLMRWPVFTKPC